MNIRVSETLIVVFKTMPVPTGVAEELSAPVVFWIVPPEQPAVLAEMHVPVLPVTVSPPLAPVLLRTMPLGPPLAEILRNVSPLALIVVFRTLRAIPPALVIEQEPASVVDAVAPLPLPPLKPTVGADV